MKSQFLKPLADVSLSRSASNTVLVPEWKPKGERLVKSLVESATVACNCLCTCTCLTSWWGQCYVQVPSPGVFNAGLHLQVLQWVDCVLLALTGFGWYLYSDFTCCLQVSVGCMKIAGNETHKQPSLQILQIPLILSLSHKVLGNSGITASPIVITALHDNSITNPNLVKYLAYLLYASSDLVAFAHSFAKTVNPHLYQTWMKGFPCSSWHKAGGGCRPLSIDRNVGPNPLD